MTTTRSRLAAVAVVVTALAMVSTVVPARAQEPPAGQAVTVAAIVESPTGPVVERHRASSMQEAHALVAALQARDEVVTAEADVRMRSVETVSEAPVTARATDTVTSDDPDRHLQWAMDRLDAEESWEIADAQGQVVAVVDSGVDANHPDLEDVVVDGLDVFDPGTLGRVDPLEPCPGSTSQCRGHGTHVAGIIAAVADNAVGIAGLARGASIMPVRVLDPAGFGTSSDVAEGILFAADNGADVINLSLGSPDASALVDFAVAHATRRGALVVAAAGNGDTHVPVLHPAVDPWTLAVGATDHDDAVAAFSGKAAWVDLAAPGVDIYSTRPTSGSTSYGSDSGTSMATPYVSAAAALVMGRYPFLAPTGVAAHLRATATDLAPFGRDHASGDGLVNPLAALTSPTATASVCDASRVPSSGFDDTAGTFHLPAIHCVVWFGVAQGTTADTYVPAGQVTRAQMASFIARMLDRSGVTLPSGDGDRFTDVSPGNVHLDAINRLAAAGIVQGRGSTYAPQQVVTRDQMASFLVRSYDYAQDEIGRFRLAFATRQFEDTAGNVHEININKAANAGLANGVSASLYAPRRGVRRDQMATFVIRAMERLAAP